MMRHNLAEEDSCILHGEEQILAICEKFGKSYCASCFRQGMARCLSPKNPCDYRGHCLVKQFTHWLEEARHKGEIRG